MSSHPKKRIDTSLLVVAIVGIVMLSSSSIRTVRAEVNAKVV